MRFLLGALIVTASAMTAQGAGRAMTVEDLLAVAGVSGPEVSPDGKWVVYVVTRIERTASADPGEPRLGIARQGVRSLRALIAPDGPIGGKAELGPLRGRLERLADKVQAQVEEAAERGLEEAERAASDVIRSLRDALVDNAELKDRDELKALRERLLQAPADLLAAAIEGPAPSYGKTNSDLWLVPVAGGEPKRLTTSSGSDTHPRWSPDGKTIAFVSDRSGSNQVWLLPLDGGEARPLTRLPIDVSGPIWSPKGDKLAFVAEVYPGTSPEETAKRDKAKADAPSKARAYDQLMVRHWMSWDEGKRSHLFVCDAATGEARDLVPEWTANVPPAPFGGSNDYAWSPDGEELAFTSEPLVNHAWSTNTDIWTVPARGGAPKNLTEANLAADAQPAYSPDGRMLAFVRQERPGFEADRWVLHVLRRGGGADERPVAISGSIDRPIGAFSWDSGAPILTAIVDDSGHQAIYEIPALARQLPRKVLSGASHASATALPDRSGYIFTRTDAAHPAEVYRADADGSNVQALTHHNDDLIKQLDLNPAESFTFKGAEGDEVQGWLIKPPGFDPAKRWPVLFLIHGGPQGAWHDEWHNRWNYGLFAAPGYVVVAVNPRGSTGFGQKFTDAISRDWNGKVYADLMAGLDFALKTYSFLDESRVAAAGGSFGGYMVNWIAGQTDRFQCLISHAGIFDLTSMNVTTEELWFSEWEFGGMPWQSMDLHRDQSPSTFAGNFKSPTLVVHGALDFRVPDSQGLGMFTALRRQGVPSRYLWFPDEGHWIAKPANRIVWWREVHGWLAKYLKDAHD